MNVISQAFVPFDVLLICSLYFGEPRFSVRGYAMRTFLSLIRMPVPVFAGVLRDRRGAVAVLLAIALSAIVGFAGLGSEVAGWYYTTRSMQSASDAAATSAAAELAYNTAASSTQVQNAARAITATYNFTNGTNSTTVTVNNPPATTTNLTTCS